MNHRHVAILALGGLLLTADPSAAVSTIPQLQSTAPQDAPVDSQTAPRASRMPRDPSVLATLGRMEVQRGNERQAAGYFQAALAFGGLAHEDAVRFAWLLAASSDPAVADPGVALRIATDEIKANPDCVDSQLFAAMALAYASIGNVAAAEEWREKVLTTPDAVRRPQVIVAFSEMLDRVLLDRERRTRTTVAARPH